MRLITVEEMKELERLADENGLSYKKMMENAGMQIKSALRNHQV